MAALLLTAPADLGYNRSTFRSLDSDAQNIFRCEIYGHYVRSIKANLDISLLHYEYFNAQAYGCMEPPSTQATWADMKHGLHRSTRLQAKPLTDHPVRHCLLRNCVAGAKLPVMTLPPG